MDCPNCHEEHGELLGCEQCGFIFCSVCQPYWDYTNDRCQACQERNSIAALQEEAWTDRMRKWFNPEAELPKLPNLGDHSLPWRMGGFKMGEGWIVHAGPDFNPVALFASEEAATYAVHAANSHHDLATAAAETYNRIRNGQQLWRGSEEDVALWTRVKAAIMKRERQ